MVWMACWIIFEAKNNQPCTKQPRVNRGRLCSCGRDQPLWQASGSCGREQVLVRGTNLCGRHQALVGGIRLLWEGSAKLVAIMFRMNGISRKSTGICGAIVSGWHYVERIAARARLPQKCLPQTVTPTADSYNCRFCECLTAPTFHNNSPTGFFVQLGSVMLRILN